MRSAPRRSTSSASPGPGQDYGGDEELPQPVQDLFEAYRAVERAAGCRVLSRRLTAREQVLQMFNLGLLSLEFGHSPSGCTGRPARRSATPAASSRVLPEELEDLESILSDTYFCNFSVFQSLPDSWAIDQLFPILPNPPPA